MRGKIFKRHHRSRLLLVLLMIFGLQQRLPAQEQLVNLQFTNTPIQEIFQRIKEQTNLSVIYNTGDIDPEKKVSIHVENAPVSDAVSSLLQSAGGDVFHVFRDNYIVLSKRQLSVNTSLGMKQKKNVTGNVVDQEGEPLIGVNVVIEGAGEGTATDINGNFSLNVEEGENLTFSYIGYATETVSTSGVSTVRVVLREDGELLDELVVTALGIRRSEKALSYNVQQIGNEAVTAIKDANFMNTLSGKIAGVQINNSAVGAGGAVKVVMRGAKSLSKDNNALYVIDGIPMYNTTYVDSEGQFAVQPGSDGVADINPEDIESVSILTGPSAAALYGSDAANGVVIINTKSGKRDETTISASSSTTFSSPLIMPKMQNRYGNEPGQFSSWGEKSWFSYDPSQFFNTGTNVTNAISFSTGTQKNQTYASAASTNTRNILPNSGYNRYNFTVRNTSSFLKNKMTLDTGTSYIIQDNKNMMSQGQYFNPLLALYLFPRGDDFSRIQLYERWDEGRNIFTQYWPYDTQGISLQNPYWIMNRMLSETKKKRYLLNASLKYQATDWLNLVARAKVDVSTQNETTKRYAGTDTNFAGPKGMYSHIKRENSQFYGDAMLNIDKEFSNFRLNANIGASIKDVRMDMLGWSGNLRTITNFFSITNIDNTTYKDLQEGSISQTQSVFGNVELSYRNMIFLNATGRNDWDSKLAYSAYSSFFYPSSGLSVLLSEIVKLPEWVSLLKLRGSYSNVGSPYSAYLTHLYYEYVPQTHTWNTLARYPNTDLKPEKTTSSEFGLNARLFGGRLKLDATYYSSNTFNQTFEATISSTSAYSSVLVQAGKVQNYGVELTLGYNDDWEGFSWDTNLTYTMNRNKIIRLANGVTNPVTGDIITMPFLEKNILGSQGSPRVVLFEGGTMGDIYIDKELAKDHNGNIWIDPQSGAPQLENVTSRKVGSLLADCNLGWNNNISWKSLNLGFLFTARVGGSVVSNTEALLDYYGVSKRSADARDQGGVTINNGTISPKSYFQTIGAGTGAGAYYVYDATNVRLQELSLGYTLPHKWFRDQLSVNVSLVGRNIWMIYNKAPFDPELSPSTASTFYQGVDYFMLPSLRNIGFSIKIQM